MVMEVIYQLTQRDFVDSLIAHRNRSPIRKWFLRLIVSIVFAAVAVTLSGVAMHPNSQAMLNATPLLVLGALLVVVVWIAPWRAARNQFSKQPAAQGPRTILLDKVGVHRRWNGGSSDVEWENFVRFLESKNQLLLYSLPVSFTIVPKRGLTPEQLSEFRALVAQNISPSR